MQEPTPDNSTAAAYPVHLINAKVIADQAKTLAKDDPRTNMLPIEPLANNGYADYRVGPGDILGITVWNHPELTVNATTGQAAATDAGSGAVSAGAPGSSVTPDGQRVSADGTIYFPTIGRINVGGKTTEQISNLLMSRLAGYAVKPQLDVRVVQFRSQQVYMAGQLKNPGTLPITDMKLTLIDAITRSGGAVTDADLQRVQLTRNGKSYVLDVQRTLDHGDISQNIVLRAGDIVYVPDHNASRVFVLGEILKPQTLYMDKGQLTLADALSGANSIDPQSAQPRQILVIRRSASDPAKPTIYRLDMTQVDAILLSTQFDLQPLDVVYVGTADIARLNRLLVQLLPTVTSLYLLYSVGH
ncbi:polysaccharide biosynthesis/export family protein [Paraburkholderia sp. DHOC27]|uniref:polysaccharide biosynthesis/export family protein n=1 Tax=Paraburkholderia sp. DHOC27 TaxID=2303330 RepID=UPI00216B5D14|nr:polysaccharide biosynthesis/export family protein [Paraburkholderia sp. DHOC27]